MEYFQKFPIHINIKNRFLASIENNKLAHAYLFYGPEGSGKEAFAFELARVLNCKDSEKRPCYTCSSCRKISQINHPDIKFVFPTAKAWEFEDIKKRIKSKAENPYSRIDLSGHTVIPIERIRELKTEASYANFEADYKVYIFSDCEKMTRESANSFLKLLEEPPQNLLLFLMTTALPAVLDTIRSRCQPVYFPPLSPDDAEKIVQMFHTGSEDLRSIIQISQGNLKEVFELLTQTEDPRRIFVLEYLRSLATGNVLKLSETIDQITANRDKNFLKQLLNLLILWFRDTVYLIQSGEESEIVNIDFKSELINFAKNYRNSNFNNIIDAIDLALVNMSRNVYNPLLLTVLADRIKHNLVQQK